MGRGDRGEGRGDKMKRSDGGVKGRVEGGKGLGARGTIAAPPPSRGKTLN